MPTMWKNSRRLGRYSRLMGSANSRSCCHAAVHITTATAIGSSLMVTVLRYTWCLHLAQNEVPQADAMAHTAATSPFFWKFRASHLRHSARCFPCSYAQVLCFNIIYIHPESPRGPISQLITVVTIALPCYTHVFTPQLLTKLLKRLHVSQRCSLR